MTVTDADRDQIRWECRQAIYAEWTPFKDPAFNAGLAAAAEALSHPNPKNLARRQHRIDILRREIERKNRDWEQLPPGVKPAADEAVFIGALKWLLREVTGGTDGPE